MTFFATSVLCFGVRRCLRMPRVTAKSAALSLAFLLAMTAAGKLGAVPWSARQMAVMYSFAWVGFTMGAFPSRRLLRECVSDWHQGKPREERKIPSRYGIFMILTVTLMLFLAYLLAT